MIKLLTLIVILMVPLLVQAVPPLTPLAKSPTDSHYHITVGTPTMPLHKIKTLLLRGDNPISIGVMNKAVTALRCAKQHHVKHNNILTVIDYSLPSNQKRFWVFDLVNNKLLFHTYVSHGIKSGTLLSRYFSDRVNGKTSSIGVYNTGISYRGRHGYSLKLDGLDRGFNGNAYKRFIVMHGSWYVNKAFVDKYGRIGRSWGCPALPRQLTKPIIDTIRNQSILVIYYPDDNWLFKSKYLNCDALATSSSGLDRKKVQQSLLKEINNREAIYFVDANDNDKRERNEPIATVSADHYMLIFNDKPPLKRMLRRQIKGKEYIALSHKEFERIYGEGVKGAMKSAKKYVHFIIPYVYKLRGFYATEMRIVDVKGIQGNEISGYTVSFKKKVGLKLKQTDKFIRWLGL